MALGQGPYGWTALGAQVSHAGLSVIPGGARWPVGRFWRSGPHRLRPPACRAARTALRGGWPRPPHRRAHRGGPKVYAVGGVFCRAAWPVPRHVHRSFQGMVRALWSRRWVPGREESSTVAARCQVEALLAFAQHRPTSCTKHVGARRRWRLAAAGRHPVPEAWRHRYAGRFGRNSGGSSWPWSWGGPHWRCLGWWLSLEGTHSRPSREGPRKQQYACTVRGGSLSFPVPSSRACVLHFCDDPSCRCGRGSRQFSGRGRHDARLGASRTLVGLR